MIDLYVWLTPLLMLGVMGLVGFVGCDIVFGLDGRTEVAQPTGLTAKASSLQVKLQWTPYSDPTAEIIVRRSIDGGAPEEIERLDATQSEYPDLDITLGAQYTYTIAGVSGNYESDPTPGVNAFGVEAFVLSFTPGTVRADFIGPAGTSVQVGARALTVTHLGRIVLAGNTATHLMRFVRASNSIEVAGSLVTLDISAAIQQGATQNAFAYVPLTAPITLEAGELFYLLSDETTNSDTFLDDLDTQIQVRADASVPSAAYREGQVYQPHGPPNSSYGPVDFLYFPVA